MAELVVYRGHQYPANRLPKGADPRQAVPVAEWFRQNRTAGGTPVTSALLSRLRGENPEHKAETPPAPAAPEPPKRQRRNRG